MIDDRRYHLRATLALLPMLAVAVTAGGSKAAEIAGAPVVVDGRTLEVAGQQVRLWGIDAPDLDQTCSRVGRDYDCGSVARAALWDLVSGLDVVCTPVEGAAVEAEPDLVVATCTAGGFSLNENMVHTGWALADPAITDRYVATGEAAKTARRGLWHGEFDPPAAWRSAGGGGGTPADGTSAQ
jgi:endonuclease YncB( thermonuclease family)